MPEAKDIHNALTLVLLTVGFLLIVSRCASPLRTFRDWPSQTRGTRKEAAPAGIDGSQLYYERTPWPQYEAKFNLRLSYVYGPVIVIRHQSNNVLVNVASWLGSWVWRGPRNHADTTILINSLPKNGGVLKGLLRDCASRRPSIAAGKYLSRGRRIVLQPYGPDWLRHRRAFSSLLTKEKINTRWAKALRHEAMVMVGRVAELEIPTSGQSGTTALSDEVSRFTASSVLQITYARRAESPRDPILGDLQKVSQNIASAFTPGKYWVDSWPLLDIFPAFVSPWKRKLNSDHRFELALFEGLLRDMETRLGGGESSHRPSCDAHGLPRLGADSVVAPEECAAAELLRAKEHFQLDREDIAYLAAGIFEAGTETTAMTINTFLLAAACYPEMTQRAQAEIDGYMDGKEEGGDLGLTFADLQNLPYLGAAVKEALRLTPTGSSGVGHTPTQLEPRSLSLEGEGDGQGTTRLSVPPGATVLANTYGLHHDQDRYPEPWCYSPDRWLSQNSDQGSAVGLEAKSSWRVGRSLDHTHANFAFGFGRRICPGSSLASYSLSISIALFLLCFDFKLTSRAMEHYKEAEKHDSEELRRWTELFPTEGSVAMQRERRSKQGGKDEHKCVGNVLIDAYIAFKLSKEELAECIRLEPRKGKPWLKMVGEALVSMS